MPKQRSGKRSIIRTQKDRNNPFVVMDRRIFDEDRNLSWKAKGLLGYFLSRPDDWSINMSDLEKRSKDGRDSVRSGLHELIDAGYVEMVEHREKGRFDYYEYIVYENPDLKPTSTVNGKTVNGKTVNGKTVNGKSDTTNNDFTNNLSLPITDTSMYVCSEPTPDIHEQFASNYKLTGYAKQKLTELIEVHGESLVSESLDRAIKAETDKPIAYMTGVLRKWSVANIEKAEDIEAFEKRFRDSKQQKKTPKKADPKRMDQLPKAVAKQMEQEQNQTEEEIFRATKNNEEELQKKRIQHKIAYMDYITKLKRELPESKPLPFEEWLKSDAVQI